MISAWSFYHFTFLSFLRGGNLHAIRLVSVVTLPSLIGQIMLMVISRALSTSSSESLSLSLELSAYSLFGDSGKLASSFELKSMRRG